MKIGIIGAGQMGAGIAQIFATYCKCTVMIYDVSITSLQKATDRMLFSLTKMNEKKIINCNPQNILSRITYCTDMNELCNSNIIVESASENFDIKTNILYALSEILSPTTMVASNTSSYSITSLARMLPYPEQFLGFHFMNPPPLMELVEVIRGHYTSDETFNFFWNLAIELQKTPIESKNTPGFVLNRVLIPMINEAANVLHAGIATVEHIDNALKLGANHPLGPLALADLIGIDTIVSILHTLRSELGDNKYTPSPILIEYVKLNYLGKKTKRGFYLY